MEHISFWFVLMMLMCWTNLNTIKKKTVLLLYTSKEVGLKVNAEIMKYILVSRHQNAGQKHETRTACKFFGNVTKIEYFGTMQEQVKIDFTGN
jgi:hypothetical protein